MYKFEDNGLKSIRQEAVQVRTVGFFFGKNSYELFSNFNNV